MKKRIKKIMWLGIFVLCVVTAGALESAMETKRKVESDKALAEAAVQTAAALQSKKIYALNERGK